MTVERAVMRVRYSSTTAIWASGSTGDAMLSESPATTTTSYSEATDVTQSNCFNV